MPRDVKMPGKTFAMWTRDDIERDCPKCGKFAIVALTPALRAKQPDDTTHVCHPGFGGCNHGFAIEVTPVKLVG